MIVNNDYIVKKEHIEDEMRNNRYRGEWTPKKIPNPNYDPKVKNLHVLNNRIAAIGIDIFLTTPGVHFDNFIISDTETTPNVMR